MLEPLYPNTKIIHKTSGPIYIHRIETQQNDSRTKNIQRLWEVTKQRNRKDNLAFGRPVLSHTKISDIFLAFPNCKQPTYTRSTSTLSAYTPCQNLLCCCVLPLFMSSSSTIFSFFYLSSISVFSAVDPNPIGPTLFFSSFPFLSLSLLLCLNY